MKVLGISCFYHDAAAALVADGCLVAAAEEERFSRIKHDFGFPRRAIRFCLEQGGVKVEDLDLVVFYEKPFRKFDRILMTMAGTFPRSAAAFREAMLVWLLDKLWVRDLIAEHLGCPRKRIVFCPHHLSHAASAFYCSPFEKAAVLTVDGVGEWATGSRGTAWDTNVRLDEETRFPHSVGLLYSAFTAFLGFQVNEGEYKVMGMAPYGEPRFAEAILDRLVDLREDGSFRLNMDYFSFHYSAYRSFSERFVELFGRPRAPEESDRLVPHYADVAASIQKVTEEILLRQARHLQRRTGHRDLVMAGGVALNSVANTRILRESGFDRLYIQPAAGDGGGALGAALWGYHEVLGGPRLSPMRHAYWGQEHDDAAVADFLRAQGCDFQEFPDEEAVCREVAQRLARGQVVGWMQGRFEWGPRALGHRSILADPRDASMKDVVNARIKFREPFRPFAPSVLAERLEEFFDLPDALQVDPARFMLLVVPVKRDSVPAVTHVDGTARIQAVHREECPRYHRLIECFSEISGVPVVLNTSFNLKGEPIVNTPAEAWSTFSRSEMDALVMGRFITARRGAREERPPLMAVPAEVRGKGPGLYGADPPEPPRRGLSRLARVAGRGVAAALAMLLALEVLLRLFFQAPQLQLRGMYTELSPGEIVLTPGWEGRVHTGEFDAPIRIGEDGLREMPGPREADREILVLGDSFVFGCWSPAERTWLARAERALGPGVRLINAGVPNYGTDGALDLLRRRLAEGRPDAVVLGFFTGNDFADNMLGKHAFTVDGGYLVTTPEAIRRWGDYNCYARTSGSGLTLSPFSPDLEVAAARGGAVADAGRPRRRAHPARRFLRRFHLYQFVAGFLYGRSPRGVLRPSQHEAWCLKDYRPEMEAAVRDTWRYLDDLLSETRHRGLPLALVVIPSSVQVYPEDLKARLERGKLDPERFDPDRPTRLVLDWARDRGVPALDLTPAFRGRERMYYRHDMHWNDLGHFQAGERLAAFLRRALP